MAKNWWEEDEEEEEDDGLSYLRKLRQKAEGKGGTTDYLNQKKSEVKATGRTTLSDGTVYYGDKAAQYDAQQNKEITDMVRGMGDYLTERKEYENPAPTRQRETTPDANAPYRMSPEAEYNYQVANSGPNKLTPYQVYMNAQVSASAEPEPQTWKRPTGPEAPTQKLTPDVEAEYQRRASGQGPSNTLTPYTQYRATYEAQRQNEAKKARENAESGWSYASDTLKGGAQAVEAMMQNPLAKLDKLDYWIARKIGGTFGGMKANTQQAYDAAHAIDADIQRSVSAAKEGKGKWASSIIDAFGAAGNIFGSSMMGYGLTGMGTATNALNTVAGKLSAASAGPGASLGERVAAGASRLAGNVLGDIAANPTNLFISAQSGIGTFDTAKSYGADDRTAAIAGMAAAMTEYFSNKMFSGTPLEDNPNEKGYVVELLEDITDGLAKTGNAGARFQKYAGQFFSNPVVNFVFDKSGEGMEEVITGVLDPWIARLTYNKEEDLATFETLFDDYIGGVLMSLLVGAPQAAVNATRGAVNLVTQGADNGRGAGWTGNTFNAYTQRFMQNPDWAEKSRGSAEIADKAGNSDSESLRRYAGIYNRTNDVIAMLNGEEPASVGETAFVNSMEAQNYFYIWDTQGARAADAYYEQNVYAAARNRQAQAEATYQQQAEKQAREAARQQAEQEALARQAQAEETLAAQDAPTRPPVPQNRAVNAELQQGTEQNSRLPVQDQQETAQERTAPPVPQQEQRQEVPTPPVPQQAQQERVTTPPVPQSVQTAQETAQEAPKQSGRLIAGTAQSGKDNTRLLWTAPKDNGGWKRQYNGDTPMLDALKATNEDLLAAYMSEATEGNTDTPVIDAVIAAWEDVRQGTISPMAGAELVNQMWQAGKDDASRRAYLQSIYNPSTGNLTQQALKAARNIDIKHRGGLTVGQADNPAAAVGQQANAGKNENASAAEAAEAGNDLADGGRGGLSGQRAGEQNGRLAEAKRAVSQYNKASGRRADAKNLRAEEVDARGHIAEAAKGSKITIAPEQMVQQDKELRTVAQRLEEITGKKVYYTIGNIQRQGADGSISQARGAITADGIYLRCDHNDLSVTQIGAHELYHYYEDLYPGLSARMKEKIIQTYSEAEFNKVAQVYVKKLGAICGLTDNQDAEAREAALARIEKEIFADAFGSINYGGAKADRFNALVRQTLSDTMGAETAAATARRTGPPETKFSLNEFEDGKKFVDVQTDQDIFDGLSDTEKLALARRIIKKRFAGKVIGLDNQAFVNGRTGEEYSRMKQPLPDVKSGIMDAKARVSTELDNLVDAGFNYRTAEDGADGHKHPNLTGPYVYFDAIFKVGNEYFQGVVNMENNRNGRRLKDVTKIRNITKDTAGSYGNNPTTRFLRNASMPTVAETKPDVNTDFSADDVGGEEELASLKTRLNDLKEQEKAFKEAAEYQEMMDAVTAHLAREGSRFAKDEAFDEAVKKYNEWHDSSGYSEVFQQREALEKQIKDIEREQERRRQKEAENQKEAYRAQFGPEMAAKYAAKAARKFGTTSSFNKAGYLTTTGSMLDFSARQGYRVQDHREIADILDFLPDDHSYSAGMIEFMNLGNIRMQNYGIDISKAPNAKQIAVLRRFFN